MSQDKTNIGDAAVPGRPLGAFRTFAAWMAALFYLAASMYALGSGLSWWPKRLGEMALLTGLGGLCTLWIVPPLSRLAWPAGGRAAFVTKALALLAAGLAALSGLVLPTAQIYDLFRYSPSAQELTLNTSPFDSPVFWLLTLGLLGPWLIHVNQSARKALAWPAGLTGTGLTAGIVLLLVPLTLFDVPFATAVGAGLATVGGLSLALWVLLVSARTGSPGGLRIAVAVFGPLVLLLGGVQLWARGRMAEHEKVWESDLAEERTRVASLRMPVLSGEPEDCNAVERYLPLMESLIRSGYPDGEYVGTVDNELYLQELLLTASSDPFEAFPPKVVPVFEARRGLVTSFRASLRCERVDWRYPYERGFEAPLPGLLAARWLASLTLVRGHELAQAGDVPGAIEHYLDVMRFGTDFQSQGVLGMTQVGIIMRDSALSAIGSLAVGVEPGGLPAETVAGALRRITAEPASVLAGYRSERLLLVPGLRRGAGIPLFDGWVGPPLYAHTLDEMVPLLRSAEAAENESDPVESAAILGPTFEAAKNSRNPITATLAELLPEPARSAARVRAREVLVGAALAAEIEWSRHQRYPDELSDLPLDPFAHPSRIQYRVAANGTGYTLWSVGENREDDGARGAWSTENNVPNEKDLVLARAAR